MAMPVRFTDAMRLIQCLFNAKCMRYRALHPLISAANCVKLCISDAMHTSHLHPRETLFFVFNHAQRPQMFLPHLCTAIRRLYP